VPFVAAIKNPTGPDRLPTIAARHDVVKRTKEFDTEEAGHAMSVAAWQVLSRIAH